MDSKVALEHLQRAASDELQAVHQYMYWHFHMEDQGYPQISALLQRVAIAEMKHMEAIAERMLFLGGDVEMVPAAPVKPIQDVQQILALAAQMEMEARDMYNASALACGQAADAVTRKLFESLVEDEEKHYDLFQKWLEKIQQFGPKILVLESYEEMKG